MAMKRGMFHKIPCGIKYCGIIAPEIKKLIPKKNILFNPCLYFKTSNGACNTVEHTPQAVKAHINCLSHKHFVLT